MRLNELTRVAGKFANAIYHIPDPITRNPTKIDTALRSPFRCFLPYGFNCGDKVGTIPCQVLVGANMGVTWCKGGSGLTPLVCGDSDGQPTFQACDFHAAKINLRLGLVNPASSFSLPAVRRRRIAPLTRRTVVRPS